MANATARVQSTTTPWGDSKRRWPLVGSLSTTYYPGCMMGVAATGYAQKLDDTAKLKFIGINCESTQIIGESTDSSGDKFMNVDRPWLFTMLISSAAITDVGKKVYAQYDQTATFSPGTYSNLIGRVFAYHDSTTLIVAPPWSPFFEAAEGYSGTFSATADATTTLTRMDLNKIILVPNTAAVTINLPAVALCSPGDRLIFVKTSADAFAFTLDGASSETINGATTLASGTSQYQIIELVTDGDEWFALQGGASSFSSNVVIGDTYTLTVGSASQQTVSDGDGSTNLTPAVQVLGTTKTDASVLIGGFNTTNDSTVAPSLNFLKSGHASIGSNTAVAADEIVGELNWFGADGTDFESPVARISGQVDATVGTGDMPGRLVFYTTADGGETLTEVCRMTTAQNLCVSNGNGLIVGHTAPVTAGNSPETQILGTAAVDSSLLLGCFSATDSVRGELGFLKSGAAAIGAGGTIVANGESLGGIVWYADDGVDLVNAAAALEGLIVAAPGSNDTAGGIQIMCSPDGSSTLAEVGRITSALGLQLGVAGTKLGQLNMCGNTSGVVTIQTAAAAGTWTLTLPADDGDAGEQLQTNGSGVATWEAAGSMAAVKNLFGELSSRAREVLDKLLGVGVYDFTYREGARTTTGDFNTHYTGVLAEELPEVMHHNGRIFSPVSAFGLAALAIKALAADNAALAERVASLEAKAA